jgi:hypothetical protein
MKTIRAPSVVETTLWLGQIFGQTSLKKPDRRNLKNYEMDE